MNQVNFLFFFEPAGDPWIKILEFCEKTGHATDEFGLYDG
jgi:hypothetical protein